MKRRHPHAPLGRCEARANRAASLAVLALCLCPAVASSEHWETVPLPPEADWVEALAVGRRFVYTTLVDSGNQPLGVFRTLRDDPGVWEEVLPGMRATDILTLGTDDEYVFAAASLADTTFFASFDGGQTWRGYYDEVMPLRIHSLGSNGEIPGKLYLGDGGYATEPLGAIATDAELSTWQRWIPCDDCPHNGLERIGVPPGSSTHAYLAGFSYFMTSEAWVTTDGGATWDLIDSFINGLPPIAMEVDPLDAERFVLLDWSRGYVFESGERVGSFVCPTTHGGNRSLEWVTWDPQRWYLMSAGEGGRVRIARSAGLGQSWSSSTTASSRRWWAGIKRTDTDSSRRRRHRFSLPQPGEPGSFEGISATW